MSAEDYGITLDGFSDKNVRTIRAEFQRIANKLWSAFYSFICGAALCPDIEFSPVEIFKAVFGPMTWTYDSGYSNTGCDASDRKCGGSVSDYSTDKSDHGLITHEFGHLFDHRITGQFGYGRSILGNSTIKTGDGNYVSGVINGKYERGKDGYRTNKRPDVQHPLNVNESGDCAGNSACEDFADMFMNWVQNSFSGDVYGQARYNWMDQRMGDWVVSSIYRCP